MCAVAGIHHQGELWVRADAATGGKEDEQLLFMDEYKFFPHFDRKKWLFMFQNKRI